MKPRKLRCRPMERVVVLCHTLCDAQLSKALDQVERRDQPVGVVLLLRSGVQSQARAMDSADVSHNPSDGPANLISAVGKLLPAHSQ